ncbi:hypothetical protein KIPB_012151, partial [Kipferlia bialata]
EAEVKAALMASVVHTPRASDELVKRRTEVVLTETYDALVEGQGGVPGESLLDLDHLDLDVLWDRQQQRDVGHALQGVEAQRIDLLTFTDEVLTHVDSVNSGPRTWLRSRR